MKTNIKDNKMKKNSKDIFFEYLNTAEIVYKDDVCITNISTRKHAYNILPSDIKEVCINPNHTFSVLFSNGEKNRFELYVLKAHYHSTDEICIFKEDIA